MGPWEDGFLVLEVLKGRGGGVVGRPEGVPEGLRMPAEGLGGRRQGLEQYVVRPVLLRFCQFSRIRCAP